MNAEYVGLLVVELNKAISQMRDAAFAEGGIDNVFEARDAAKFATETMQCAEAAFDGAFLRWLGEQPGQSVEFGEQRYYVAEAKTIRGTGVPPQELVESVMDACGGDIHAFAECLAGSPSAWRIGQVKTAMPDSWEKFFKYETRLDVKTGKPAKVVAKIPAAMSKNHKAP